MHGLPQHLHQRHHDATTALQLLQQQLLSGWPPSREPFPGNLLHLHLLLLVQDCLPPQLQQQALCWQQHPAHLQLLGRAHPLAALPHQTDPGAACLQPLQVLLLSHHQHQQQLLLPWLLAAAGP